MIFSISGIGTTPFNAVGVIGQNLLEIEIQLFLIQLILFFYVAKLLQPKKFRRNIRKVDCIHLRTQLRNRTRTGLEVDLAFTFS